MNNIVYINDAYEYIENLVKSKIKNLSERGKLSEEFLSKVDAELSFIKGEKIAFPLILSEKLISYSEQNGYNTHSSKLNINTPLVAYLMGIIEPHSLFYDYSLKNGKIVELTFSKNVEEKILSFISAMLGKDDYEDTGVKIDFI